MIVLKFSNQFKIKPTIPEIKVDLRPDIPSNLYETKKPPKFVPRETEKEFDSIPEIDDIDFLNDVRELMSNIKFKENKKIKKKSTKLSLDDE